MLNRKRVRSDPDGTAENGAARGTDGPETAERDTNGRETAMPESPVNPEKTVKPIKRVSLAGAVFFALLLAVGVFLATFTAMSVRLDAAVNAEKNAFSGDEYSKLGKLDQLLSYVREKYVRGADEETLWDGIYAGLLDAVGDPYSEYMTAEEFAAYTAERSGNYVGIGVHVTFDQSQNAIAIYRIAPDSPAERAGLQKGDLIVAVEDVTVSAATYNEAVGLVAGEEGTDVSLTVRRGEEMLAVSVTRSRVESGNVLYEKIGDTAYLTILSFSESNVTEQFQTALTAAKQDGCTSYLFDLRNNPGGNLDVVCAALDELLPANQTILHMIDAQGNDKTRETENDTFLDAPMAVLCNGNTASAAELFTADLQDYGLATVVGETTYGKGTMQTITSLPDGSAVKLTSNFYNPASNVSYDGIGVHPDVEVKLTEEQSARFYLLSHEEDPQLQAALKALGNTAD